MTNTIYQQFHAYKEARQASPYSDAVERSILDSIDRWWIKQKEKPKMLCDFDEYIFSATSKKERVKCVLLDFYHAQNQTVETRLNSMTIIDDETRRIVEEIKYLQQPRTMRDLANHFGLSQRSIQRDLSHLQDGIVIDGSSISLKVLREGKKRKLQTFMQPVYLNLSKVECVAITQGLKNISEIDPVYGSCLKRIAGKVYAQLPASMQKEMGVEEVSNDFDEEAMDALASELGYKQQMIMMLDGHREGEVFASVQGKLTWVQHCYLEEYDVKKGTIYIRKTDGTRLAVSASDIFNCNMY